MIQSTWRACALSASTYIFTATAVRSWGSQDNVKIPEGEALSSDIVTWHPCDLMQVTQALRDVSLFEKKQSGKIIKIVTVPVLCKVIVGTKFYHRFYNPGKLGGGFDETVAKVQPSAVVAYPAFPPTQLSLPYFLCPSRL